MNLKLCHMLNEHSTTLRPFTLFNLCSILLYMCFIVIKHISNSFTTAAGYNAQHST